MKMKILIVFFMLTSLAGSLSAGTVFDWNINYQNPFPVFDGSHVYPTSTTNLNISNQFTAVAWVKFSDLSTGRQKIVYKGDSNQSDIELSIGKYEYSPKIEVCLSTVSNSNVRLFSDNYVSLNEWVQIVVVYDWQEVRLYLNGQLNASAQITGNLKNTSYSTYVGGRDNGDYLNGTVRKITILDYAYTDIEIANSYTSSFITPSLFNWNSFNINPAPVFDGTHSYPTSITNLNILNQFTAVAWVKFSDLSTGRQKIVYKGDSNQSDIELSIGKYEYSPKIEVCLSTVSNSNVRLFSDNYVSLNEWVQIVVVYDGQEVRLYLNGQLNASAQITGNLKNTSYSTYVGGRDNGDYLNGNISKIEIYDYVNLVVQNDPANKNLVYQWLLKDQSPQPVFDGTTSCSTGVTELGLTGSCTISAWVLTNGSIVDERKKIFYKGNQNQDQPEISLGKYEYGPSVQFRFKTAGNQPCGLVGGFIRPQRWTHIAGVYDSQHLKLYVNGQLVNSAAYTGAIDSTTFTAFVGGSYNDDRFDGIIESIRIQSTALTDNEISLSYNLNKDERVRAETGVIDYQVKSPGQKIIYSGWNTPTTMFVRDNWQSMDSTPLDGTAIEVLLNRTQPASTSNSLGWQLTSSGSNFTVNDAFYTGAVADMTSVNFTKLTENVMVIPLNCSGSNNLYWYDSSRWNQFINNWRVFVKLAAATGCKGIIVDVEDYGGGLFNYQQQLTYHNASFADYKTKVTTTAQTMMTEMNLIAPQMKLHFYYAWSLYYDEVVRKSITPENSNYGLLLAFLDGLVANANTDGRIVDLHEFSYGYLSGDSFSDSKNQREDYLETLYTAPVIGRINNSFGLWMDYGSVWDTANLENNYFTPKDFSYAIYYALKYGGDYIWIYSHNARFFLNKNIPDAYLDEMNKFQ